MIEGLPEALLLDLDDTILRYGAGGEGLWREVAAPHARALGVSLEQLEAAIRAAARPLWSDPSRAAAGRLDMRGARREIVRAAFEALGLREPERAERLADAFTWEREARVAPLPGAIEALEALRAAGHRLALLTNGGPTLQRAKLARFGLSGFFEAVLVEGELGFGKPDGRVFALGLAALGRSPDEVWMVGDNLGADIAGAQAAGIHAVWVDHAGAGLPPDAPARPDRVVQALAELLNER